MRLSDHTARRRYGNTLRKALLALGVWGLLMAGAPAQATLPLGGPVLIGGDDADDHGFFSGGNQDGWYYIQKGFDLVGTNVGNGNTTAVCLGCNSGGAQSAFASGFDWSALPGLGWTRVSLSAAADITNFFNGSGATNLGNAGLIYMPTDYGNVSGGITSSQLTTVNANAALINAFVASGGGLFTHSQADVGNGYGWLTTLLPGITITNAYNLNICSWSTLNVTPQGAGALPGLTDPIASNATPWHTYFTGNLGGLDILVTGPCPSGNQAVIIGGGQVVIGGSIVLNPTLDLNPIGSSHTVTATVSDLNGPLVGELVGFLVTSGPNAGANGSDTSNGSGQATFTYPDSGGAGVDVIKASFTDAQAVVQTAVALKFWDNDCNQNGVADACDIDCGALGSGDSGCGAFVNPPCGTSTDGNGDDIPDDCQQNCVPVDCDDSNPCTDDACSAGGGFVCLHTPNSDPCDDLDPCTLDDTCTGGDCDGTPVDCNDNNPCTDDLCDSAGSSFLCLNPPNGSCVGNCGNGVVDAGDGETCDPPNPALDPNGRVICRPDCTRCGDGIPNGGEVCDDGNIAPACRSDLPQKPTDECQNNCTRPLCEDPARIKYLPGYDSFKFHGRLTVPADTSVDFSAGHFVIELRDGPRVIFRKSLLGSDLVAGAVGYKFADKAARAAGGVYKLKVTRKPENYKLTLTAYGDLAEAVSDMTTRVYSGSTSWTVRGLWQPTPKGWILKKTSTFLDAQ